MVKGLTPIWVRYHEDGHKAEYSRAGDGRWWNREEGRAFQMGRRLVRTMGAWAVMGDLDPVTGEECPDPKARLSHHKQARLPSDLLSEVLGRGSGVKKDMPG